MSGAPRSPWPPIVRATLYVAALFLLGDLLLLRFDPTDGWALFGEYGRLEVTQAILSASLLALCVSTAVSRPVARPLAVLLAGLATCALLREHNNWFKDEIGENVWQVAVGVILLGTALLAYRLGGSLHAALLDLVSRPAFGWMAAGVACALFGQLLDTRSMWEVLLGPDVPYAAQRMAEESLELAALWLASAGALEWRLAPRDAEGPGAA